MALPQRFERHLAQRQLIPPGARVVVALSGGADSTALLLLLHRLHHRLQLGSLLAAHLHHGLRAEADDDENFCRQLADRLQLELVVGRVDVRARARDQKRSVEDAARRARYAFLLGLSRGPATRIATAHNADDRAETLLLALARGQSRLAGIQEVRSDGVVRPLLGFGRDELRAWLCASGESWREDASNRDLRQPRAAIRARVLPELSAIFGGALVARLGHSLDRLAEADTLIDELAARELETLAGAGGDRLDFVALQTLPPALARRVLVRFAAPEILPDATLAQILEATPRGPVREFCLRGQRRLRLARGHLERPAAATRAR